MLNRPPHLSTFIQIAEALFQSDRLPDAGRAVAAQVFARLQTPSDDGVRYNTRYPACAWLDAALAPIIDAETPYGAAARAIKLLEPDLGWSRRSSGVDGSANYIDGHVHGMVCGPGGAESRHDLQLGLSIMVPHVRYPDHSHPPEEAYVLLTDGEFRQRGGEWFNPGFGSGIHNAPNSQHAMKSGAGPFLAIWCLLV